MKKKYLFFLFGVMIFYTGVNAQLNEDEFSENLTVENRQLDLDYRMRKNAAPSTFTSQMEDRVYGEGKSAMLKSLVVPGWGLYTASENKMALVFLPISYGTLGYGLYARFKGKTAFEDYRKSIQPGEMEDLFQNASKLYNQSRYFIAAGVCSYFLQLGFTYLYSARNDEYRERNKLWKSNQMSMSFSPEYNPYSDNLSFQANLRILINQK